MGVIHDDAVTNVNRKTLARETSELQTPPANPEGVHHRGAERRSVRPSDSTELVEVSLVL